DIPFDIFSAAFYLVTRYEEYSAENRDEHGRYMASASLAFRNGFLQLPVIDMWTRELALLLARKFRTLSFRRNEFGSILTMDADQPFAYLGRSLLRSVGGMLLDIGRKDGHASERYRTVAKGELDPFNVFDYILSELAETGTEARFFFPVGDNSRYDVNPSWKSNDYRDLISKVSERHPAGIHPSYYAADDDSMLSAEIERLGKITGNGIHGSRYHYIRLFIPRSYKALLACGISEDYSMGYPEEPGFRAGIARPFMFYDAAEDIATSLRVYPFMAMDATFYKYKEMSHEESLGMLCSLIDSTRNAGGLFSTIWHNTSLLDDENGRKWRKVFEAMLKYQKK
ncbi:MAG: polysaccharide deacetylase family protein, partial [Bacteroidales bacterium]|nr:polysaccharide deacetylase family protein [Bacteroidales bacterium]